MNLTPSAAQHFAQVFNFVGELRFHHRSLKIEMVLTSRRQAALERMSEVLGLPIVLLSGRHTLHIRDQDELHELFELAWPHLTEDRQIEFNSLVERQKATMHDRAVKRAERERIAAEAARRATPSYEQRLARAEQLYDNSDPAVQVIESLSPEDAIAAELAAAAQYRVDLEAKQKREMTVGQINYNHNAPRRKKRKYTRKA